MVTFTIILLLVKILSLGNCYSTKIAGLGKKFIPRKFLAIDLTLSTMHRRISSCFYAFLSLSVKFAWIVLCNHYKQLMFNKPCLACMLVSMSGMDSYVTEQ